MLKTSHFRQGNKGATIKVDVTIWDVAIMSWGFILNSKLWDAYWLVNEC